MSKEIINRVANSDLITIDLSDYAPNVQIIELDLKQFLFEGNVRTWCKRLWYDTQPKNIFALAPGGQKKKQTKEP